MHVHTEKLFHHSRFVQHCICCDDVGHGRRRHNLSNHTFWPLHCSHHFANHVMTASTRPHTSLASPSTATLRHTDVSKCEGLLHAGLPRPDDCRESQSLMARLHKPFDAVSLPSTE